MGNPQNRKSKKKRIPPSKRVKKFKDGEPSSQNQDDSVKEGTVFMDLEVLFGVFGNVLTVVTK